MRPVAAAGPVARVRLMVLRPRVAAGLGECRLVHLVQQVCLVRPAHQVAAENCSDADLPGRCQGVGRRPEVFAAWPMEPLSEEAEAEMVRPAATEQPRREASRVV